MLIIMPERLVGGFAGVHVVLLRCCCVHDSRLSDTLETTHACTPTSVQHWRLLAALKPVSAWTSWSWSPFWGLEIAPTLLNLGKTLILQLVLHQRARYFAFTRAPHDIGAEALKKSSWQRTTWSCPWSDNEVRRLMTYNLHKLQVQKRRTTPRAWQPHGPGLERQRPHKGPCQRIILLYAEGLWDQGVKGWVAARGPATSVLRSLRLPGVHAPRRPFRPLPRFQARTAHLGIQGGGQARLKAGCPFQVTWKGQPPPCMRASTAPLHLCLQ